MAWNSCPLFREVFGIAIPEVCIGERKFTHPDEWQAEQDAQQQASSAE
jgi:hypothetical protein